MKKDLEYLIKYIGAPSFIHDLQGNIKGANGVASAELGYDESELVKMNIYDLQNPDDKHSHENSINTLQNRRIAHYEITLKTSEGDNLPVHITSRTYDDSNLVLSIIHDITDREKLEHELTAKIMALDERNKELKCLYYIARLVENRNLSPEQLMQKVVKIIPETWQYPQSTGARIIAPEGEFRTEHWDEKSPRMSCAIESDDIRIGRIEVCVSDKGPEPFLPEEKDLLQIVAAQIGRTIRYKQIEEALIQSEENISTILHSLGDGVITTDTKGRITMLNPTAEELTGYSSEEASGKPLNDIFYILDADTHEEINSPVQKALEYDRAVGLANHVLLIARDGSQLQIADSAAPIRTDSGEVTGVVLVFSDVSDEYEARRKLQERTRELETFFEVVPEPLCIADTDGQFIRVNSAWEKILGYTARYLQDQNFLEFVHQDDLQSTHSAMEHLEKEGSIQGFTNRYLCRDGSNRYMEWNSEAHGKTIYAAARDITERKQAENALKKQLKIQKLLSDISADFVNASAEEVEKNMQETLEKIGKFMGVERVHVHRYSTDTTGVKTYEWCARGIQPIKNLIKDKPPCWCDKHTPLEQTRLISDISQLPTPTETDKKAFAEGLVNDLLCVPIETGGDSGGTICLNSVHNRLTPTEEDITVTKTAGEIIFAALSRAEAENYITYLTFHDPLTGLYNRTHFERSLLRLKEEPQYPMTIVSADVDGLKIINDTMGHNSGDQLLKLCADAFVEAVGCRGQIARIGGDEFGIILTNTSEEKAEQIEKEIEHKLEIYNKQSPEDMPLQVSLGTATTYNAEKSLYQLRKEADNNMYRKKLSHQGSGRRRIIDALLAALAERDHITQGHAQRLETICEKLGKAVDLSSRQLSDLQLLAQVHDLGKVGVSDKILFKEGPLNEKEWEQMRQHTEKGYRVALSDPNLAVITDLILKHHERWDGKGYPLGLSKENIPIECRILAIADAFDAITNNRPYRNAKSIEYAKNEIKRCAGSQFDPELVDVFLQLLDEGEI